MSFKFSNLTLCKTLLSVVWFSYPWKESFGGLLNSWGSITSLTFTVLFHHLYQGDTWSWPKEKWFQSRENREKSARCKLSRSFQLSGSKDTLLNKLASNDLIARDETDSGLSRIRDNSQLNVHWPDSDSIEIQFIGVGTRFHLKFLCRSHWNTHWQAHFFFLFRMDLIHL